MFSFQQSLRIIVYRVTSSMCEEIDWFGSVTVSDGEYIDKIMHIPSFSKHNLYDVYKISMSHTKVNVIELCTFHVQSKDCLSC